MYKESYLNFVEEQYNSAQSTLHQWINRRVESEKITIHVVRSRKRKLGDYRFNANSKKHDITINNDLTEAVFTLTTLHEIAHKITYDVHGRRINPHGREWKMEFCKILSEALNYTDDVSIKKELTLNLAAPRASFKKEQLPPENGLTLAQLNNGDRFKIQDYTKEFTLIKKLRKRFQCKEVSTSKIYTVSPNAVVIKSN